MMLRTGPLVIVVILLSACAAANRGDRLLDAGRDGGDPAAFQSVSMFMGGGQCADEKCWRTYGVSADKVLALEDADGKELFKLTPAEYQAVIAIVTGSAFADALTKQARMECGLVFDSTVTVEFESDHVVMKASNISGCLNDRDRSDHIYNKLYWQLQDLRGKYLACRAMVVDPGYQPGVDPWPERALCHTCYDCSRS